MASLGIIWGLIKGPSETPRTSEDYDIEGFKWTFNSTAIMPRDASLSDSRCNCFPFWTAHIRGVFFQRDKRKHSRTKLFSTHFLHLFLNIFCPCSNSCHDKWISWTKRSWENYLQNIICFCIFVIIWNIF